MMMISLFQGVFAICPIFKLTLKKIREKHPPEFFRVQRKHSKEVLSYFFSFFVHIVLTQARSKSLTLY